MAREKNEKAFENTKEHLIKQIMCSSPGMQEALASFEALYGDQDSAKDLSDQNSFELYKLSELDIAIKDFVSALECKPHDQMIRIKLGNLFFLRGFLKVKLKGRFEGVKDFKNAADLFEDFPGYKETVAPVINEIALFQAMEESPIEEETFEDLYDKGCNDLYSGEFDNALTLFIRACEKNPGSKKLQKQISKTLKLCGHIINVSESESAEEKSSLSSSSSSSSDAPDDSTASSSTPYNNKANSDSQLVMDSGEDNIMYGQEDFTKPLNDNKESNLYTEIWKKFIASISNLPEWIKQIILSSTSVQDIQEYLNLQKNPIVDILNLFDEESLQEENQKDYGVSDYLYSSAQEYAESSQMIGASITLCAVPVILSGAIIMDPIAKDNLFPEIGVLEL
jgi:tetratricopeptide (TPR) repeat protein